MALSGTIVAVARNAFGDLFLHNDAGKMMWLDVASGRISEIADSQESFRTELEKEEMRQRWFATNDEAQAAGRGLVPGPEQCIGFSTPLAFAESGYAGNPYIADLYDYIPFLGNLHRQIADLPAGTP